MAYVRGYSAFFGIADIRDLYYNDFTGLKQKSTKERCAWII